MPAPRPARSPKLVVEVFRIGRYEVLAEIASGGMGRVYLARMRGPAGFEKLVALKCIHPELATDGAFVDMFLDEARIAARIDHPNACRVFDFGEADGRYYLAMEYLVGLPLSYVLRAISREPEQSAISDELVARLVADAAEGLHAAHELTDEYGASLEVVHRDVSPHNLFVTYDGSVRVVDFGVASARGRLHQTSTGSVKGKLAYMPPEQLLRQKLDRRADIWSLGVVAWELLTRRRLFRGESEIDVIQSIMNDPVRRPSETRAIDEGLEAIVLGALERDRERRTATARDLAQALNRWIVGRGAVVGMPELAAFMAQSFAEERTRALELADEARRTDTTLEVPVAVGEVEVEVAPSPAPPDPALADADPGLTDDAEPEVTRLQAVRSEPTLPDAQVAPPARRGWVLPVALVATALLGAAAALALGGSTSGAEVASTAAQPSEAPRREPEPVGPVEAPAAVEAEPSAAAELALAPAPAAEPTTETETERTEPARDRRTPARGRVVVQTPGGWADVYSRGRLLGRTPLDTELPAGAATLELRPFGLATMSGDASLRRRVVVGARPVRITVRLTQ